MGPTGLGVGLRLVSASGDVPLTDFQLRLRPRSGRRAHRAAPDVPPDPGPGLLHRPTLRGLGKNLDGKAASAFQTAAKFFAKFRDLTAGGFYTTPVGWKDLGYVGNVSLEKFDGPPLAALKKAGLA